MGCILNTTFFSKVSSIHILYMRIITYWFDDQKEMIYFDNGYQSLVANSGQFIWKINGKAVFFHEDMVDIQIMTGYIFKQKNQSQI